MTPADLAARLGDCYAERLGLLQRHQAVASHVAGYDANNAYQYVIAREETHLEWLHAALAGLGSPLPDSAAAPAVAIGRGADAWRALAGEDASALGAFVARWEPRVAELTHARHRTMLTVLLGETREHQRFFADVAAGRVHPLGRTQEGAGERGAVIGARWVGD